MPTSPPPCFVHIYMSAHMHVFTCMLSVATARDDQIQRRATSSVRLCGRYHIRHYRHCLTPWRRSPRAIRPAQIDTILSTCLLSLASVCVDFSVGNSLCRVGNLLLCRPISAEFSNPLQGLGSFHEGRRSCASVSTCEDGRRTKNTPSPRQQPPASLPSERQASTRRVHVPI
ncbi:unnamed protein product [Protopolystoma xenopodis]|uniref:Uncharacterized protein n=1 Tax=Protopolystoma xenopodis TaxID=117903 RepID=A0A448X9W3_9PLAT|nr:unnamed protein product [Protopolystoma xenopodis]